MTVKSRVKKRPAETATVVGFPALTAVLISFGIDPVKAAAFSGLVASVTPIVVTYLRERNIL